MNKVIKLLSLGVVVVLQLVILTGCQNTVSGFTQDVSKNTDDVRRSINNN